MSDQENRNHRFIQRSLASVWHPCTQMKHHENFPLVPIARGEGVYLIDMNGARYLDAVSSWWVNLFGHANPRINAALKSQLDTLEHAMLAGFTHEPAIELAERLHKLTGLGHAFFASDGASAVEIALKMSFHFWRNHGQAEKTKFISLEGSYHGETLGALSVTDVAIFKDAYAPLLNNNLLTAFPQAQEGAAPCCSDCADEAAKKLEAMLSSQHHEIAAIIIEPLVQGAAGMRMYHSRYLQHVRRLATQYNIHVIADEIMTGFGRTGTMFAWEQANAPLPDFMCLSKGITGGYLPLSCVLTTDDVYAAFYDDRTARGFLHSHSYTGSALACRAALATLDIFASDDVIADNREKAARFNVIAKPLREHLRVTHFRHLGMIWAFEVTSPHADFARAFFSAALQRGILVRPISRPISRPIARSTGNTIYLMPPYIIDDSQFAQLIEAIIATLDETI